MLSYRHSFHAGNHADILKHLTLISIFNSLNKKEKSYTFFDTHSGRGLYSLESDEAKKTMESEKGISSLMDYISKKNQQLQSELLSDYISFCRPYYHKILYPGSAEIEQRLSRKGDAVFLCELHKNEFAELKKNISSGAKAYNENGFAFLKRMTPPQIKRGAVLIDPSYEDESDYDEVVSTVCEVHKKWSAGIIAVWYPLLAHRKEKILNLVNSITDFAKAQNSNTAVLCAELTVNTEDSHKETTLEENASVNTHTPRLYGSGMLVLNVPWKTDELLNEALPVVTEAIQSEGRKDFSVRFI